ncbi:MAG: epoxyqueuosine reductase, partial [Myxococcota bacterium]
DACPTAAFPQPYVLDARLCLSYLNIEMAGPIEGDVADSVGHQLYGCDICQDVCPWNRKPIRPNREVFLPRDGAFHPRLEDVLAHDDETFAELFDGSPVERRGRTGLQQTARLISEKGPQKKSEKSGD